MINFLGEVQDNPSKVEPEIEVRMEEAVPSSPSSYLPDERGGGVSSYQDHFSLAYPSSYLKFQDREIRIYSTAFSQTIFEKKLDSGTVQVKEVSDTSIGLFFLRAWYTLISLLMSGFLFVFCIQLVLFLFLGLAIESGLTSIDAAKDPVGFAGTILSIPYFVNGLASVMTIATSFVVDTWQGQKFFKTLSSYGGVLTDWLTFLVFIIVPILVAVVLLFKKVDIWWEATALTWFVGVLAYFVIFAHIVVYYEVDGCLELMAFSPRLNQDAVATADTARSPSSRRTTSLKLIGCGPRAATNTDVLYWNNIKRAIILCQKQRFSGVETLTHLVHDSDKPFDCTTYDDIKKKDDVTSHYSILSRLTNIPLFSYCGLYKDISPPCRSFSIDEVLDDTLFITGQSWGLEKFFCRNRQRRTIGIIKGPSSLSPVQARSSFIAGLSHLMVVLVVVAAFLTWLALPPLFVGLIILLMILTSLNVIRSMLAAFGTYRKRNKYKSSDDESESQTLFSVTETFRVNEATEKLCFTLFFLEIFSFFVIPVVILFWLKNFGVAVVFTALGLYSMVRKFLNIATCITELGSLEGIEKNNTSSDPYETWKEKSRLNLIVKNISQGRRRNFWIFVFAVFVFLFCLIFMAAIVFGSSEGLTNDFTILKDFYYEGNKALPYPTCRLGKGLNTPAGASNSLVDYVFLSNVAYQDTNTTQKALDDWFGQGFAVDHADDVEAFKKQYEDENGASSVRYKFITFNSTNSSVVSIRGTSNAWDALADAQLWSSAALAQYVRALLPVGEIWTPILMNLVKGVSLIETKSLKKVSYYYQTRAFVNEVLSKGYAPSITGHSLGGGLAIITGTQTGSPVVALSGPNALISRRTFDPPLHPDDINRLTFNIIPDRDPVPRIDDPAQLYQRIKCRSASNDPVGCHFAVRSLCEVLYECGSLSRGILCDCVKTFNYPIPLQLGNRTFEEACP